MKVGILKIGNCDTAALEKRLFCRGYEYITVRIGSDSTMTDALAALHACKYVFFAGRTATLYKYFSDRYEPKMSKGFFEIDGIYFSDAGKKVPENALKTLDADRRVKYFCKTIMTVGVTEKRLRAMLGKQIRNRHKVKFLFESDDGECSVTARWSDRMDEEAVSRILGETETLLAPHAFVKSDTSVTAAVSGVLRDRSCRLWTAESFTGGRISSLITGVAGASAYYRGGFTVYTKEAKIYELGVPEQIADKYGTVSYATAEAMIRALLKRGDTAIATTGNAGPSAEQGEVGFGYVAVGYRDEVRIFRKTFRGNRAEVIAAASKFALKELYNLITSSGD